MECSLLAASTGFMSIQLINRVAVGLSFEKGEQNGARERNSSISLWAIFPYRASRERARCKLLVQLVELLIREFSGDCATDSLF